MTALTANAQAIVNCPTNAITNVQVNYTACLPNASAVNITVSNPANVLNFSINGGTTTQTSPIFTNVTPGNYVLQMIDLTNCISTYAFTVSNPAIPQFTAVTVTDASCIGNSGVINVDVAGGTGVYNYFITYSSGVTFPLPSDSVGGFVSGTYTITAEDANGCEVDTTVTVQFYGFPIIDQVVTTNPSCTANTGTIEITVLNPPPTPSSYVTLYTINYGQNYQTSNIFTNLAPGTYFIYVLVSGCLSNNGQPIIVTLSPESSLAFSSVALTSPDCGVNNGSIQIQTIPPSTNSLFSINNGPLLNNLGSFANLGPNSYLLTVLDSAGCPIDTTVTLLEEPGPSFTGISVTPSSCGGSDGSIQVFANQIGTSNLLYSIDNGLTFQTDSLFLNVAAGLYTVTVQQNINCMVDTTILVTSLPGPSIVSLNSTPPQCGISDGQISIVSSASPSQYSINGGFSFQANGNFNNLPSGFYNVIVQTNPGCTADTVVFFPDNSIPIVDAGSDTTVCANLTISLNANATAGALVNWDNGITDGVPFTPSQSQTYTVTATLPNGCSDQDQVNVVVLSPIEPTISAQVLTYCLPSSVVFSVDNGVYTSCLWTASNGDTETTCANALFTFNAAGCYSVNFSGLDVNDCPISVNLSSPICFKPNPNADFIPSPRVINAENPTVNFFNTSLHAQNYTWIFPNGNGSNMLNPSYTFPEIPGFYDVILIAADTNGCLDTVQQSIEVKEENYLYVPNAFTPNGDEINQVFRPVLSEYSEKYSYQFRIYNRWGELLFESKNPEIGWDGTYGGELVKTGVYAYEIKVRLDENTETTVVSGHVNVLK